MYMFIVHILTRVQWTVECTPLDLVLEHTPLRSPLGRMHELNKKLY